MTTQIYQWLEELKESTEAIANIDLEEEANDELLLFLQNKQVEIRNRIDVYRDTNTYSYDDKDRQLIRECLDLEDQIKQKFQAMYSEASNELARINSGKRSRDAYQGEEIQSMGYFIDRHR
ncbi:hypothetical protein [Cohnella mopanensis]|uniref:hypothetical protein n=1 Tax=Cohnella mopanensis TaxID=2911966 RepID=UPI001EF89829|nr:hypothetical protein [Cohnella mopanensis]